MGSTISIETLREIARTRAGKCLSNEYINSQTPVQWECSRGHKWFARPAKVKHGSWCKECSGSKKKTIEEMHELANQYGAVCLSDTYTSNKDPLDWTCEEGHSFSASYSSIMRSIKKGRFCKICAIKQRGLNKRNRIEDMHLLATSRGGNCLSKSYTNSHIHLEWKCGNGHIFSMKPNSVKNGHWCPSCRFNLNENKCRFIIESLTEKPFKSNKKVLQGLELDGYNDEIRVGFEYNGIQHYQFVEYFHKTIEEFYQRKEYDLLKENLCMDKGIHLITIPYRISEDRELAEYIYNALQIIHIKTVLDPSMLKMEVYYKSSPKLNELREIASSRGGSLVSNYYHNNKTKLTWKCEYGHVWDARPNDIKSGQWCSVCNGSHRLTIEEMHHIAEERGGKCLSQVYVNSREHLKWECSKGHQWGASASGIKNGNWCVKCRKKEGAAKRKLSIEEMNAIAESNGGKCLSTEYINSQTHLLWECSEGHHWKAKPGNIKQGTWCPRCKNKKSG